MRLYVKTDDVGAEEAFEKLPLPGADAKRFRIGPRNVPEHRHARVRPLLFDQPRQQRKVIVLNEHERLIGVLHLLQHRFGEHLVHALVLLPVGGAERRTRMGNVAERPEPFVRKAEVVAVLLRFRQPDAAQHVPRHIRRHAHTGLGVDYFAIGVAGPMRDPGAVAGAKHRFERGDEAAGRHERLDRAAPTDVFVRFAVGDHEQTAALQTALHADAKPLRGPKGIARLAQPRFVLGRGRRGRAAVRADWRPLRTSV